MHRTIHLEEYIFFSSAHGTFSRIDYSLGHNTSFIKFKKAEIISSMFFHHKAIRVEINYKAKSFKKNPINMWRLNNMLLGKLSSGHRTGKGQFSFQFQRKAMSKNAQTTAQLHSSHVLVK